MNSTRCCICDNEYIYSDIKVKDYFRITEIYRGSTHRDCIINVKLIHKIHVVFHNLKNYDSHLIMQEMGKFNLKVNVIPSGLETYMIFSINEKLTFINSFRFLGSSLENLDKDDFKYLDQKFDNNVLGLAKRKGFYEYMSNFKKFKGKLLWKEKFYSSWRRM